MGPAGRAPGKMASPYSPTYWIDKSEQKEYKFTASVAWLFEPVNALKPRASVSFGRLPHRHPGLDPGSSFFFFVGSSASRANLVHAEAQRRGEGTPHLIVPPRLRVNKSFFLLYAEAAGPGSETGATV